MPRTRKPDIVDDVLHALNIDVSEEDDEDELAVGSAIPIEEAPGAIQGSIIANTHLGKMKVYDTETGEESEILRSMAHHTLRQLNERGNLMFTMRRPKVRPFRGSFRCPLHPDDPNRKRYDDRGLVTCNVSNLRDEVGRDLHLRYYHPLAWQIIKADMAKEEAERIRREDREHQERMAAMQVAANKALFEALQTVGRLKGEG